ncbi:MCE family protein [Spongiibacter sp. KMU-158]|uniref:MCE family protein n=1 Tax=Spongiibacter pelagi TaxID=2760804 RepID=A0A927C1X0_9GAMM|nr:MlaD family protein [Spongiibacter pelagi]MBD2859769.1 MCE family protein [Spongiibacter pelagi]
MPQANHANIDTKPRLSGIWLLPLLAALIAGWMLYKNIGESGLKITVAFSSGSGITAGQTPVIYQGITVGKVTGLHLNEDFTGVSADIEIDQQLAPLIRKDTQFWLVSPQVSLSRISGLDTLVSGNYISFRPGESTALAEPNTVFTALAEAPIFDPSGKGLALTLTAKELGSISVGAPILYQQITVGEIEGYRLSDEGVEIQARIEAKFSHLLKAESRFWNISGVQFKAGLDGVEVNTGSLQSIIAGGVAFDSPATGSAPGTAPRYTLHANRDALKGTVTTQLILEAADGLHTGTAVRMQGLKIGEISTLEHSGDPLNPKIFATLAINADSADLLNQSSEFWLVKPEISGASIRGIDTLISGPYIAARSASGDAGLASSYRILPETPNSVINAPGLRLSLSTDELHSVDVGSKVYFRKIAVGQVESVSLNSNGVSLGIFIHEAYRNLVRRESRFFNASGIHISGGLSGMEVQAESMAAILAGGIAFYNPEVKQSQLAWEGLRYPLYSDYKTSQAGSGMEIVLHFSSATNLAKGTEIKYQGIKVGEVTAVSLDEQLKGVAVSALLNPSARELAKEGSKFWLVTPQLGLVGSRNLETLVTGSYIGVEPGYGSAQKHFQGLDRAPTIHEPNRGLNLVLLAPRRGSVKEGVKVFFRDIPVGEVYGYRLSEDARQTEILINIETRYAALVKQNSQFWNSSGIDIDFSLFKGANIRSKSVESLLGGGIAFATPETDTGPASSGSRFVLHDAVEDEWLSWSPSISLEN